MDRSRPNSVNWFLSGRRYRCRSGSLRQVDNALLLTDLHTPCPFSAMPVVLQGFAPGL
ncbi:hypothetical protein P3T21_006003 [Paraburkholderia sp. GAS334]